MKIGMILAVAALAVAGCGKKDDGAQTTAKPDAAKPAATAAAKPAAAPVDPKAVAVEVNGKKLTFGELLADVDKLVVAQKVPAEQAEDARKYFTEQLAKQFAMKTILMDEAAKKGLKATDEDIAKVKEEIVKQYAQRPGGPKTFEELAEKHPLGKEFVESDIKDNALIKKLIDQEVDSKVKVDEAEIEKMYTNITSNYEAQAKAALDAEAAALPKIQGIKKQLDGLKGDELTTKFAELAKANSDCPSKEKGGDLGEFTKDRMVKEFADMAFSLDPFVVSEPVKTQFGYHLIMVTKKIAATEAKGDTPASPEKVQASHILVKVDGAPRGEKPTKDQVKEWMTNQEKRKAEQAYVEGLRKAATIVAPTFPSLNPPPPAPAPAAKPAPAKVESAPVEVKPATVKPAEAKPAEAKPAEAKPAEAKPAEAKPAEAKPAEAKPAEEKK